MKTERENIVENGLISIIVPVYNTGRYLEKCIGSLVQQSYEKIEVIAVNDGSSDESLNILEKFADRDKRVLIISQINRGISDARNTGLKAAHGEFIVFVDSDDWIDDQTCEKAINKIRETNSDVVLWAYTREYSNSSKMNFYFGASELNWSDGSQKDLWRRMIGPIKQELREPQVVDSMITVWGKLYRRNILQGISFVDTNIIGTEDALFNIQVFSDIQVAVYIPETFSHYRKSDITSFTHLYKGQKVNQWKEMYKRIYAILEEHSVTKEYYVALENRICLGLIGLGLNLAEDKSLCFFSKRKELHKILTEAHYQRALKQLDLSYFPVQWKIFFFFAKQKYTFFLTILLCLMNHLRGM